MIMRRFELGDEPRILLNTCIGDVKVSAWKRRHVQIHQEEEALQFKEYEGRLEVTAAAPITLSVPRGTTLIAEHCSGRLAVRGLGAVSARKHLGDIALDGVAQVEVSTAHGAVAIHHSDTMQVVALCGTLLATDTGTETRLLGINGPVRLEGMRGTISVRNMTGHLTLINPMGNVETQMVHGRIELCGALHASDCALEAHGDICLSLDPDSDVQLDLRAIAGSVNTTWRIPGAQQSWRALRAGLGERTARVTATSRCGSIELGCAEGAGEPAAEVTDTAAAGALPGDNGAEPVAPAEPIITTADSLARQSERERAFVLELLSAGRVTSVKADELLAALNPWARE